MNVYEIVTERLLKELENGTVPWRKPWISGGPKNLVSQKAYRGLNRLLLADSPWWITYKQAASLGGQVKAGAKSAVAIFWKIYDRQTVNDEGEDITTSSRHAVLRYYNVFRLSDCEIPEDKMPKPPEGANLSPIEAAEAIVRGYQNGPTITYTEADRACYSPALDLINIPKLTQFKAAEPFYCTLFHEMVHSTGHKSRLNRFEEANGHFGSEVYSKEELVAEIGSAFLCGQAHLENTLEQSAAYINSWKKKLSDDPRLVVSASSAAQKAADLIFGITE